MLCVSVTLLLVLSFGCVCPQHVRQCVVLCAGWIHHGTVTVHLCETFHTWVGLGGVWPWVQILLRCVLCICVCLRGSECGLCCVCFTQVFGPGGSASGIQRGSGSPQVLHLLPRCSEPGPGHSQPYLTPFHERHPSQNSLSILLVIQKERRVSPSQG